MAISCEPADLMSEARLIDCCVPRDYQLAVLISLFCTMANVSCDSADLMDQSKCIDNCIPDGSKMAVLVYLACQIVNNGGGGGGVQQVYPGHYGGSAPNAPNPAAFTPAADYAIAPDLDSPFQTFVWNPDTDSWT